MFHIASGGLYKVAHRFVAEPHDGPVVSRPVREIRRGQIVCFMGVLGVKSWSRINVGRLFLDGEILEFRFYMGPDFDGFHYYFMSI